MRLLLLGETPQSVGAVLLAAARRTRDPTSEWAGKRESLRRLLKDLDVNKFEPDVRAELQLLNLLDAPASATDAPPVPLKSRAKRASTVEEGIAALAGPHRRFARVVYPSRHSVRFQCRGCAFLYTRRFADLARHSHGKPLACLCAQSPRPLRWRELSTRSLEIDYKNLRRFVRVCRPGWELATTQDDYENAQLAVALACTRCGKRVVVRTSKITTGACGGCACHAPILNDS